MNKQWKLIAGCAVAVLAIVVTGVITAVSLRCLLPKVMRVI